MSMVGGNGGFRERVVPNASLIGDPDVEGSDISVKYACLVE